VREYCPNIVFISETRQQKERVSNLRFRLDFNNSFVVDGVGKGAGVVLFWDDSIKIDLLSYGLHHVDTMVSSSELHLRWRAILYMANLGFKTEN
jgi:hypothetical protein